MKLYYARLKGGNFGDDLNPWLWNRLLPGFLDSDPSVLFVAIGSILNSLLDNDRIKVVFGSGAGYGPAPRIDERWRIYFVRGPLTAQALSIDPKLAITDAAYFLRLLPAPAAGERFRASYMCHHASEPDVDWQALCERAGIHCISPLAPIEQVIAEIARSDLVIAEAMHAAIVADAFRVPWIPVRYGYRSFDFKWHDWCRSLQMSYEPVDLPPILQARLPVAERVGRLARWSIGVSGLGKRKWVRTPLLRSSERQIEAAARFLERLSTHHRPTLSSDGEFDSAMERLGRKLDQLRADWAPHEARRAGTLPAESPSASG